MRIVHVASECAPWSQTGGLGQVAGALPDALVAAGNNQVFVVTPLYGNLRGEELEDTGIAIEVKLGSHHYRVDLRRYAQPGRATVVFADCPAMFEREALYDHHDDARRFAVLCRAAVEGRDVYGGAADIYHAHDWQAGLVPMYLEGRAPCVFTIHNLGFQGVFDKRELTGLGLDWSCFTPERLEYFDDISLLKAGISESGAVTTVSPQYAREIQTEAFGSGLDGFLRFHGHKLSGILNGIDTDSWDPANDRHIAAAYSADDLEGKQQCRAALLDHAGLSASESDPVLGIVSRFAEQKGLDLVADLVPELAELGVRMVILGSGDAELEARFQRLAARFPERLHLSCDYDISLARRIYAGSDLIAVPSRFEPCGLTQLYAMRYGALPIVCAVGGLRDTVTDWGNDELARGHGTGFRFDDPTVDGLRWAIARAVMLYRGNRAGWTTAVKHVMSRELSWTASAAEYLELYRGLLAGHTR